MCVKPFQMHLIFRNDFIGLNGQSLSLKSFHFLVDMYQQMFQKIAVGLLFFSSLCSPKVLGEEAINCNNNQNSKDLIDKNLVKVVEHISNTPTLKLTNTKNLDFVRAGIPIVESNSPEVVKGPGFIFRHDRTDATRGGEDHPLKGCNKFYFFHINKSEKTLHFHLMLKKATAGQTQARVKGSVYNNKDRPLGKDSGQGYSTAYDWLKGEPKTDSTFSINENYTSVLSKELLHNSMIDGLFEICSEEPFYLSLVTSTTADAKETLSNYLDKPADGIIKPINANAYGRVAGIFNQSEIHGNIKVQASNFEDESKWHINTIAKFNSDKHLQDQTFECSSHFSDSSCRSNGNYGRKYKIDVELKNDTNICKKYRLYFASNYTSTKDEPSFTWNCPTKINDAITPTYTTPTQPEQFLKELIVDGKETSKVNLEFIPCGLITAKQHLRIEQAQCK